MKAIGLCFSIICILIAPFLGQGQTIGGVINSYYQVIEVIPAKACVRLSNTVGLSRLDNTMLVQMKGAAVTTANNVSYGSITALNNAGNYEMGVICGISGDSVFFEQTLLNTYDVTGKVQLVRVPSYASATVTNPLLPGPWDNTTGTGGVLAVIVINTLTLNANINADTMGFKGGTAKLLNGACGSLIVYANYAYNPATSFGGSYKGEGITDVTAANSGGRGPMANGGGGGGDYNNGAGGGANISAGGNGGNNNSTSGCNNKFPGLGGLALSNAGNKIYFGGGGGNGDGNNITTPYGGGNGGGIVLIRAGILAGNNYSISASGEAGVANQSDGASGGGAGGTIIIDAAAYSGNVNIIDTGGKGGDVDNLFIANKSMGPAGGGAGGAVYFTGAIPPVTTTVNGGIAGVSYNTSPVGLTGNNSATAGSNGTVTAGYTVSQSGAPAGSCATLLLPLTLEYFEGFRQQANADLHWKVLQPSLVQRFSIDYSTDGNSWTLLDTLSGNGQTDYRRTEPLSGSAANYYRLTITGYDNSNVYSPVVCIKNNAGTDYLNVYPNPAGAFINLHTSLRGLQFLQLFSADGKLLWNTTLLLQGNTTGVALPALEPGVYIFTGGGVKTRLLIR